MKKLFKKSALSGAIIASGIVVGFAASTAIQDLDKIRDNFDYILGIKDSQELTIGELNSTIADLNAEIAELEDNQNASGKQERIKELEAQVETLTAERNSLLTDMGDLELRIENLRIYTDMYVEVEE